MAGSRTLKLTILGDVDNLTKSLKGAENSTQTFGDKMGEIGKKVGAALVAATAAAAAFAVKIGVDGVKAAIEDEQAQNRLALALENATGATKAQIAVVEEQILKTSLASGIADDQLRPALERLARATGDTKRAQDLLNLALDVSIATGKPLEAVSNAIGKAYEGNTTSLARLGLGLSTAELRTMEFTEVQQKLTDLFGGAAARNADTYQGRIDRIKVAFNEAKESIGAALLPILEKLLTFITTTVLPAFNKLTESLSGSGDSILSSFTKIYNFAKDFISPVFEAVRSAFIKIGDAVRDNLPRLQSIVSTFEEIFMWANQYIIPILRTQLVGAISTFATAASTAIKVVVPVVEAVLDAVKAVVNTIIDIVNLAIRTYNLANNIKPGSKDIALVSKIGAAEAQPRIELPFGGGTVGGGTTGGGRTGGGVTGGGVTGGGVNGGGITGGTTGAGAKPAPVAVTEKSAKDIGEAFANSFISQIGGLGDVAGARFFEETGGQIRVPLPSTFDVAAVRRAEEADRSITINVNAPSVIDQPGFANAVVDALNQAQYRSGAGASRLVAE